MNRVSLSILPSHVPYVEDSTQFVFKRFFHIQKFFLAVVRHSNFWFDIVQYDMVHSNMVRNSTEQYSTIYAAKRYLKF